MTKKTHILWSLIFLFFSCSNESETIREEKGGSETRLPLYIFNPYNDFLKVNGPVKSVYISYPEQDPSYRNEVFFLDTNHHIYQYGINYDTIDNTAIHTEHYQYDNKGRVTKFVIIFKDDTSQVNRYEYNDLKNEILLFYKDVDEEGELLIKAKKEGENILFETYDDSDTVIGKILINPNLNKIKESNFQWEYLYEYDEKNRLKSKFGQSNKYSFTTEFQYDAKHSEATKSINIASINDNKKVIDSIVTRYDSYDNWIHKTIYSDSSWNKEENITREIIYYK